MDEATTADEFPTLAETARNQDVLQWFYKRVVEHFSEAPLYLRRSEHGLAVRVGGQWRQYRRGEQVAFWRDAMRECQQLRDSNWSTKRQQALWDYFMVYAIEITFDNRRYFEDRKSVV